VRSGGRRQFGCPVCGGTRTLPGVSAPPAEGARVAWQDVPLPVRGAIERVCGAPVIEARTQPGGFSPGVAARVRCADGTRCFVKAASAELNPDAPRLHRREARVLAELDSLIAAGHLPVPRLWGTAELGPWWPSACRGAAVVDLVFFAPSVAMQGGPEPAALLARSRAGRGASREALAAIVCALAGYFTERSLQPPPPGLPTVRRFQAAQGEVTRRWLATLL